MSTPGLPDLRLAETMEKITLKPAVKEFLYKSGEENVFFDVSSYQGSTGQEKNLGALLVISQVKYSDEDLSYLVSLVSSLAKREYYSETSLQEQNPKEAFGRSLKKLNEVLDEFFQNKNFKLNMGLVAIVGENIFISRLGKFKINLARNNQLIDILNNVELFRMDAERERQFSNIISGKLQTNDKLFAFFPTRSVTSRERQINDIFVKEGQDEFGQKIAQLAVNVNNFSCCGAHIDILQIKEMPLRPAPRYTAVSNSPTPSSATPAPPAAARGAKAKSLPETAQIPPKKEIEDSLDKKSQTEPEEIQEPELGEPQTMERPQIMPAELSVAKRDSIFTLATAKFKKFGLFNHSGNKTARRVLISFTAIAIVVLTLFFSLKNTGSQTKNALNAANESLKLAQSRLGQNDLKEARSLLQATLFNISGLSGKKSENIKGQINQILANIDRVSEKQPAVDETADGSKIFASIVPKALAEAAADKNSVLYEDNLYVLDETGTTIYKYADAAKGKTAQTAWGSLESRTIAIAVDGNIYALTEDGKLIKYFKGKKEGELDLQIAPSAGSKIFAFKDSAFLYLADKTNKKVYVFDKSSGELKTSYDLSASGEIQNVSVSSNGTIWILSANNKIWQVKP